MINRRLFLAGGFLAGLGGLFGSRMAAGAIPDLKAAPGVPGVTLTETDWWDMCDKIVEHVGKTGEAVFAAEDPKHLMIGFACDTKSWQIKAFSMDIDPDTKRWSIKGSDLDRSLNRVSDKAKTVRQFLTTTDGRVRFAAALQGAGMYRYRSNQEILRKSAPNPSWFELIT